MISSRFIALADGDEVRLDSSPSSLGFQLLGADGNPTSPEFEVFTPTAAIDNRMQIDASNAAALSGGGFVVAYESSQSVVGAGFSVETLTTGVYDAHGVLRAFAELPAGSFAPGATVPGMGAFALSGDAFAIVYGGQNSGVDSLHLAVSGPNPGLTDLTLSGPVFHVDNTDGALTLGFADGSQVIVGGGGADSLQAGGHGDTVRAGAGDDSVQGGAGHDDINGNAGNDVIHGGGGGGAVLSGGQGGDTIVGGAGADFISGDHGDDFETGGTGADTFHASAASDLDVITDFNAAEGDRIELDPGTTYTVVQSGDDVVIHILGPDHELFLANLDLKNVQLSSLPAGFILLG